MRAYIRRFAVLASVVLVLAVIYLILFLVRGNKEEAGYERTNTETITDERVFDYADKLTGEQEDSLRELIAAREKQIGCDIVLVIINEPIDKHIRDYADDFYDNHKFGYDKPYGDGALYVDNWYDGYTWFCTTGRVEYRYSEHMIDRLLDKVLENTNENPYEAYRLYVETVYRDMSGENISELAEFLSVPVILLIAVIIAAVYLLIKLMNEKTKKTTIASTYVAGGVPDLKHKQDVFMGKTITSRIISTNSGGGGGGHHMSGGGRSHGGGGGRH